VVRSCFLAQPSGFSDLGRGTTAANIDLQRKLELLTEWAKSTAAEKGALRKGFSELCRAVAVNTRQRENGGITGLQRPDWRTQTEFADVVLAEGEELSSNPLRRVFNGLRTTQITVDVDERIVGQCWTWKFGNTDDSSP
jgi:hypothetical protein